MEEFAEIEERLRGALERIETRLAALRSPDGEEDRTEIGRLSTALEAEREAMGQLDERFKRLRRRHATQLRKLGAELEDMTERAEGAEESAARLLAANEALREAAHALRESAEAGVAEPARINALMREEIAALKAARAADREELDALMERLAPFAMDEGDGDRT